MTAISVLLIRLTSLALHLSCQLLLPCYIHKNQTFTACECYTETRCALLSTMNTEASHTGREEVERLPTAGSDLENGTSGHQGITSGRNDSGEKS